MDEEVGHVVPDPANPPPRRLVEWMVVVQGRAHQRQQVTIRRHTQETTIVWIGRTAIMIKMITTSFIGHTDWTRGTVHGWVSRVAAIIFVPRLHCV